MLDAKSYIVKMAVGDNALMGRLVQLWIFKYNSCILSLDGKPISLHRPEGNVSESFKSIRK